MPSISIIYPLGCTFCIATSIPRSPTAPASGYNPHPPRTMGGIIAQQSAPVLCGYISSWVKYTAFLQTFQIKAGVFLTTLCTWIYFKEVTSSPYQHCHSFNLSTLSSLVSTSHFQHPHTISPGKMSSSRHWLKTYFIGFD